MYFFGSIGVVAGFMYACQNSFGLFLSRTVDVTDRHIRKCRSIDGSLAERCRIGSGRNEET